MKSLITKLITAVLCSFFVFCNVYAASPHLQAYWSLQSEYVSAVESGNEQAIADAAVKIVDLYANPANADQYSAAAWPCEKAAKYYEKKGDFDKAKKYYKKFLEYVTYLDNAGTDYKDSIKITKSVLVHLEDEPHLYTDAKYPAEEKFFGEKWEPHNKTYFGTSSGFHPGSESATLIYIEFGSEDISPFAYKIPADANIPVDFAWNMSSESFDMLSQIATGTYDSYITKNLQFLATVKNPVFLRFAAEVNCWSTLPGDKSQIPHYAQIFKNAFIRVSNLARQHAPNAAIVYSPNDVSNWNTNAKDFYPGDEFVDWIGVSMYCNLSRTSNYVPGDATDLFQFTGLYDNPILKIKEFTEISPSKPLMISECGCGYAPEEGQTSEHAAKMIKFFYSYVNMVYPQIKMVFYFDANIDHKYKISDNNALYSAYKEAVSANIPMQASLGRAEGGYTSFSTLHETRDYVDLYTYAAFPSKNEVSVAYKLDGAGIPSQQDVPYKAVIDVSSLSSGKHSLSVSVACGASYKTYDYDFYVGENNFVSTRPLNPDIGVNVNSKRVYFDTQPQIQSGRTLVPLRAIFEALGASVNWDGATRTVSAQKGNTQIKMTIGNSTFYVNGVSKTLDVPPMIADGRTLVPVRAIGESFGCNVSWDQSLRLVTVND